jgi:hypothetical protein
MNEAIKARRHGCPFDGPDREAQDVGDLRQGETLRVVQHDDRPLFDPEVEEAA